MDFTPITSSNISGAFYDGTDMYLRFVKGPVYVYRSVPEGIYHELLAAESVGKYFHANIRERYVSEVVAKNDQAVEQE